MKNYVQRGDVLTVPAPSGGVIAGAGVLVGAIFGVAATSQDAGADVEIATVGVYELAKAAVAVDLGAPLHWDAVAKKITTVADGNPIIGTATAAAISGAATARVRLLGQALETVAA